MCQILKLEVVCGFEPCLVHEYDSLNDSITGWFQDADSRVISFSCDNLFKVDRSKMGIFNINISKEYIYIVWLFIWNISRKKINCQVIVLGTLIAPFVWWILNFVLQQFSSCYLMIYCYHIHFVDSLKYNKQWTRLYFALRTPTNPKKSFTHNITAHSFLYLLFYMKPETVYKIISGTTGLQI